MSKNVFIMVAAHKAYEFPKDSGYTPVHVGKALSQSPLTFQGDDTGENISQSNKNFCELTGLYWAWKNTNADVYGLVHYRRYFGAVKQKTSLKDFDIATSSDLVNQLEGHDIIISKPRNYYIETIRKHYENAHYACDLKTLEEVINELYPEYNESLDQLLKSRKASLYNMFIMKKENFSKYCEWLFTILFEVQKRISYQNYGPYQARVFGFMGERLLNLWVNHNIQKDRIKYLPVINIEGENLPKKAFGLLERKFRGIKQA